MINQRLWYSEPFQDYSLSWEFDMDNTAIPDGALLVHWDVVASIDDKEGNSLLVPYQSVIYNLPSVLKEIESALVFTDLERKDFVEQTRKFLQHFVFDIEGISLT